MPEAAVIDLEAFRRRRQERGGRPPEQVDRSGKVARYGMAPLCVMPVVVAWIPVWPVV